MSHDDRRGRIRVTAHAYERLRQRYPGYDPREMVREIKRKIRAREWETLGDLPDNMQLVRFRFPAIDIYGALSMQQTFVTAFREGMFVTPLAGLPVRLTRNLRCVTTTR